MSLVVGMCQFGRCRKTLQERRRSNTGLARSQTLTECTGLIAMYGVVTNLENLEYSGISLNMENSGNSVQPRGKIVTNKVFLVHHSNICVKQLLTG